MEQINFCEEQSSGISAYELLKFLGQMTTIELNPNNLPRRLEIFTTRGRYIVNADSSEVIFLEGVING